MTKLISKNFSFNKYGIYSRLVEKEDADFILQLRTDPLLGQHLHKTEFNIEKQLDWIEKYKVREQLGTDFYFIYFLEGTEVGVNRVYDINNNIGTSGSWICKSGLSPTIPVLTILILRDIMFEVLDLKFDRFDVRKQNKKVQRFHLNCGAVCLYEDDQNFYYELSKKDYFKNRDFLLKLLI